MSFLWRKKINNVWWQKSVQVPILSSVQERSYFVGFFLLTIEDLSNLKKEVHESVKMKLENIYLKR